jgi:Tfp pilus assembly protein PilV
MRRRKKVRGFSLIEILISSSLILFLIMGVAQMLVFSLGAKRTADCHFTAARRASLKLEEFKSLTFDDDRLLAGTYAEEITDPASPDTFSIRWRIEDEDENMKKVVLAIHPRHQPQRRTDFCLLLCREMEF